jgi:hypothetical protein
MDPDRDLIWCGAVRHDGAIACEIGFLQPDPFCHLLADRTHLCAGIQ